MSIPIMAGLYPYTRGGVTSAPKITLQEVPLNLEVTWGVSTVSSGRGGGWPA